MDHRYEKLLIIVEEGSYSKAAKRLRISQPAMTIAIASLEMGLGEKLFTQKKPQVVLSESGRIVYSSAKKIKKEIENMKKDLNYLNSNTSLQVGIIDSVAHLLYSGPKNNIILNDIEAMVDNSKKIINDILENRLEFGIITGQNSALASSIEVVKLNSEPFAFVKKPELVADSLVSEIDDWLCFNRASTSYHHFTKQFKAQGLKVKPIFYSTSMDLLKEMAIDGRGTALLPTHFTESEINDGKLKIVKTPKLYRPIWAIKSKDRKNLNTGPITNYLNSVFAK